MAGDAVNPEQGELVEPQQSEHDDGLVQHGKGTDAQPELQCDVGDDDQRQRMLSQRIAKFYMLREAGINDAAIGSGLKQAAQEFREAHAILKGAPENTDEIKTLLGRAETQWQLLEFSINNDKPVLAEFVAVTTDKILGTMDLAAQGYEALYRKPSAGGPVESK